MTSFVFWSTLLIYQLNTRLHVTLSDNSNIKFLKALSDHRKAYLLLLLCIIFSHLPFIGIKTTFYLAHLGMISTLYNLPENSHVLPLRSIPVLKIFLIAYVWASISSFLPAMVYELPVLAKPALLVFSAHFLFIISITLPFDIRDYQQDFEKSLVTIPHVIGISLTKILAIICLLAFTTIYLVIFYDGHILMLTLIAAFLIIQSSHEKKEYYYTLFLDGTIILYYIIVKTSFS
jgi:4-hydroxybenzoate polyprenyltransferase